MRSVYALAVVAVAALLMFGTGVDAAKKAKPMSGTLTDAVAGKEGNEGTLTVKVMPNKKKDPNGEPKEMKFQLKKDTKVQKTVGKKKDAMVVDGAFSDFQIGQNVTITLRAGSSDQAESVKIGGKKKKKNN